MSYEVELEARAEAVERMAVEQHQREIHLAYQAGFDAGWARASVRARRRQARREFAWVIGLGLLTVAALLVVWGLRG